MGTVIRIQEQSATDGVFQATVSFDLGPQYPIVVRDPFDDEHEQELEWYFEEHLRFPFTQKVRAKEVVASLITYGEALFTQVFKENADLYAEYKALLKSNLQELQIEIAGSPAFHALHWEALKDPQIQKPLALQAMMLRRNMQQPPLQVSAQPAPTINLLIVASRPYGIRDVSYRTISRPLVEGLRQTDLRVNIDILRPGTYKTLENHLREVTAKRGIGYYHVIHFDLHGSLLSYEQWHHLLKHEEQESHSHTYQTYYALKDIEPYPGEKAFLFFEGEQDDTVTPVEAAALAEMLKEHHVPVAILNACQSGKQVGNTETSLGSSLMQAGVQLVLAMGYSITVSAAVLLMKTLYRHLFDGIDLTLAIRQARNELYNDKRRQVYFAQQIDLEDWLLPVVYQNRPVRLTVRDLTPEENKAYYEQKAERERIAPPEPIYGFIGRDLDILQIEKRLLTRRNLVLVRSMGGAGKTTLLHHLSGWWRTTGLVEHVFYFGYDERAWNHQQIIVHIAQHLLDPVVYLRDFQPLSLDAQQSRLASILRAHRHMLILDNLESITGTNLAILHTLDKTEQEALQKFLKALVGGRTLVLLGSRSSEDWLAKGTFGDNVYNLPGLDQEAASTLADLILEQVGAKTYREDDDLRHLLKLLDGFPLALEVVLPNLARQTPTEVLTALQGGDVELDTGEPEDKTRSILRCIDYSHSNLSPEAQNVLLCLAPFTSVLWLHVLDTYTEHLKQQPALSAFPFERWQEVLQAAVNWGLLSPDADISGFLRLQPTLSYFLRNRLKQAEHRESKGAIETAFREHYRQVGVSLVALLISKEPRERQIGQVITHQEYENLITAIYLALAAQESIYWPYIALMEYFNTTRNQSQALKLCQAIEEQFARYPAEKLTGSLGTEYADILFGIANRQLALKQFEQVKTSCQKSLERIDQLEHIDEDGKNALKAGAYYQLGVVAREQRQWKEAEKYFQNALSIFIENKDRHKHGKTYHQLGIVAQQQQEWEQAEEYYQQALKIFLEYQDQYEQADTYHNMGIIAQQQREWEQAEGYYQQALKIFMEYQDRYAQARPYYQLGMVAEQQRKWKQAEQHYQQALQINVEYQDRYVQAGIYLQLGRVAKGQRQWAQARDYLLLALEIFVSYNDTYSRGIAVLNLAGLWYESGDAGLPGLVAEKLDASVEETEKQLRELLGDGNSGRK